MTISDPSFHHHGGGESKADYRTPHQPLRGTFEMTKHRCKRTFSGCYEYRGFEIEKSEDGERYWTVRDPQDMDFYERVETKEAGKSFVDFVRDSAAYSTA